MIFDHKKEHMPQEELSKVKARYIPDNRFDAWIVVNDNFIFHWTHTQQEQAKKRWTKAVSWSCSGRRSIGCMAKALTHWVPREGASQPQPGWPVDLVWVWRSQLHTCNVDNSRNIFIADLKNRMEQCWLENSV